MKLLLDCGPALKSDEYGVTPVISAAMSGHEELVELLLPYSNSLQERHNALKLLGEIGEHYYNKFYVIGSTYVDKKLDIGSGIAFWKRSFDMVNSYVESYLESSSPVSLLNFIPELNEIQELTYGEYTETRYILIRSY
jgi:ankyrin repeat protein